MMPTSSAAAAVSNGVEGRVLNRYANDEREWLETDGLGGFASGTVSGVRTRRYHGLLLAATTPPTGRVMLVQGFDAWAETSAGRYAISSQRYAPGVVYPDGSERIESFVSEPWPCWTYCLEDGTRIQQEIVVLHGQSTVTVTWRLLGRSSSHLTPADDRVTLVVRPFLSGRDYHATHHENGALRTAAEYHTCGGVSWHTYDGVPPVVSLSNARVEDQPDWYRNFLYSSERERGLDDTEDLYAPGWLTWDLSRGQAAWLLSAGEPGLTASEPIIVAVERLRDGERQRRIRFASPLHRAADSYLVQRDAGKTIVAGYPWFTDWGRDTFIALPGLCLSTGRVAEARDILLRWCDEVSEGMLPNRFPDAGGAPEFNAVDASLWFVMAVHAFDKMPAAREILQPDRRDRLWTAVDTILKRYARGTRFGIRMDDDGLLASGEPGVQLTWMDARVGDRVITPRMGKPVEVQALWVNALHAAARQSARWRPMADRARASVADRFWHADEGYLYDVVDVDHVPGRVDASFRPNQIFAVGGLPLTLIDPARARRVVDAVERRLLTPLGLRSLAPGLPDYCGRYEGGPAQRDAAYHQGTVWPWLIGGFVRAWLNVREWSPDAKAEARRRFVAPLRAHLEEAGLGHVSEIADAEAPHQPRGCPFQAWSLAELIRVELMTNG